LINVKNIVVGASWLCLGAAAVAATIAILGRWAVNANALGAHDLGLALFAAFGSAVAFTGATYAAPVLALAGGITLYFHQWAGLRLLAAGVVCGVPLAVYSWLE
jgi:hypothetical protein